jgi:hypothetical protein
VDVVGLYMNPPERSVIFSVDEKPETQALERTQAVLPMGRDWPEGRPHDYRRNGTVDLFAALNILDGDHHGVPRTPPTPGVPGVPEDAGRAGPGGAGDPRSAGQLERAQDSRGRAVAAPPPSEPLSFCSDQFLVGEHGGELAEPAGRKALERGSFRSVPELKQAILDYVAVSNGHASPWVWTKSADEILRKIRKLRERLRAPTVDPLTDRIKAYPSATPH